MSASKPVWLNDIERDAWVEKNCRTCFQGDEAWKRMTGDGPGCPHLARAQDGKMPTPWTRRRNAVMGETYRCAEYAPKPAVNRRGTAGCGCYCVDCRSNAHCSDAPCIVQSLMEVDPDDRHLVPVEGWPDYRSEQRKTKQGDHQ